MKQENVYAYGYARMPRVIRKGYQHLTNMQKLLYIYLRDLCGEDGVCYRSLRSLKDETGFSIGYLQKNIPVLHNEDLIHATMRKHKGTGWEIWHISIVDIWEKNAAFIQAEKEKCSQDEQSEKESVHAMNKSVHHMNTIDESVHAMNESVHAMILNRESDRESVITKNTDRELEGADAQPTHDELLDDLKEIHPVVKEELETAKRRITGEHPAVHPTTDTASHYPIADSYRAIRNIVPPLHTTLPSKGAHIHGHHSTDMVDHPNPDRLDSPGSHRSGPAAAERLDGAGGLTGHAETATQEIASQHAPGTVQQTYRQVGKNGITSATFEDIVRAQQATSEHAPGTSAPLPSAATPPGSRHGDTGSVQALSGPSPEPVQPPPPLTAPASGHIPRRPRAKKPPEALSLMGSKVMQWVGEIRGAKPRMTANNVKACNALAECDGISLESLKAYFEHVDEKKWDVDLLTAAGETGNERTQFLSFESTWPKLKKKLNGKTPCQGWSAEHPPADNDYSPKAELWRQEQRAARSAK